MDVNEAAENAGKESTGIEVFSDEERREISSRIEAASARDAAPPPGPPARGEASKKGLFPLLVNAAAILFLGAGLFLLFSFRRSDQAELRESGAELGITERALIQEIRKEVNLQLTEKEAAIDAMENRIAEVDDELSRLESLEALTDEQRETVGVLREQQEGYRGDLARLETERSQILAEARRREAEARQREERLHAQLAEQEGVLAVTIADSVSNRTEIEAARTELAKLSAEEEKAALIEKQLSGYYTAVSKQIQDGRYKEAAGTLAALKEFLATPSFQPFTIIGSRRESDTAALNALSALVAEALKTPAPAASGGTQAVETTPPPPPVPAGAGAEAALRKQLSDQGAILAEREQTLAELQKKHDDLQEQNNAARQTVAERDRQLENLQTQNTANLQKIETLQKTIATINAALSE
jgi:chromosome segregation ATPase